MKMIGETVPRDQRIEIERDRAYWLSIRASYRGYRYHRPQTLEKGGAVFKLLSDGTLYRVDERTGAYRRQRSRESLLIKHRAVA